MNGGTVSFSWGRYGGFYFSLYPRTRVADKRYWRVCAGWVALTYVPVEIDDLMAAYVDNETSRT